MSEGSWKSKSETLVDFPPGFSEYKGKATHFRAENVTKENCSIIRKFLVAYITVVDKNHRKREKQACYIEQKVKSSQKNHNE